MECRAAFIVEWRIKEIFCKLLERLHKNCAYFIEYIELQPFKLHSSNHLGFFLFQGNRTTYKEGTIFHATPFQVIKILGGYRI